jgi:hypothetical protein
VRGSRRSSFTYSGPGEAARLQQVRHELHVTLPLLNDERIALATAPDAACCTPFLLLLCLLLKSLGLIWSGTAQFSMLIGIQNELPES